MAKFRVSLKVSTVACGTAYVEAENEDEAYELGEEINLSEIEWDSKDESERIEVEDVEEVEEVEEEED